MFAAIPFIIAMFSADLVDSAGLKIAIWVVGAFASAVIDLKWVPLICK
jgi:hypothetical protein